MDYCNSFVMDYVKIIMKAYFIDSIDRHYFKINIIIITSTTKKVIIMKVDMFIIADFINAILYFESPILLTK